MQRKTLMAFIILKKIAIRRQHSNQTATVSKTDTYTGIQRDKVTTFDTLNEVKSVNKSTCL